MNPDEKYQIYQDGFQSGKEHQLPSPLTIKLMEKINIQIEVMKNEMKNISKNLEKNSDEHGKMFKKMDDFIISADQRYASKRVEAVLWAIGGAVGLIILGALLNLIIKQ